MKKILYLGYLLSICSILKVQSQNAPTSEQINKFAAIIYAESSFMGVVRQINPVDPIGEMEKECLAIGITMHNYMIAKEAAFKNAGRVYGLDELIVDSNYTKGVSGSTHDEYFRSEGDQFRREAALRAAETVLLKRNSEKAKQMAEKLQGAQY